MKLSEAFRPRTKGSTPQRQAAQAKARQACLGQRTSGQGSGQLQHRPVRPKAGSEKPLQSNGRENVRQARPSSSPAKDNRFPVKRASQEQC
jgi:hypothetical protein